MTVTLKSDINLVYWRLLARFFNFLANQLKLSFWRMVGLPWII